MVSLCVSKHLYHYYIMTAPFTSCPSPPPTPLPPATTLYLPLSVSIIEPSPRGNALRTHSTPLHHIIVATQQKPGLDLLLTSARAMGYHSIVLGRNDTRPLGHWDKKFGLKLMLVRDALAGLPPNDWVLFTDAYDVLLMRPAFDFVEALEAREAADHLHPLIFNAETYEWPDAGKPYTTKRFRLPFLNSGVYAGRVGALTKALASGFSLETDDQRFFTSEYFKEVGFPTTGIAIDHKASLFVCLAGFTRLDYELGWKKSMSGGGESPIPIVRLRHPELIGAEPYIVHFNGNIGKVHLYRVATHAFGSAGGVLAERAQWEGSISSYFLYPARVIYIALLPWRARVMLNEAELTDHVALILFTAVATFVSWIVFEYRLSHGQGCCGLRRSGGGGAFASASEFDKSNA